MSSKISGISAGRLVRWALMQNPDIAGKVTAVFPVVSVQGAVLPYICYGCSGMTKVPTKTGVPEYHAQFEIAIFCKDYDESKALAEAARTALIDSRITDDDGLYASNIKLINYSEDFVGEAYCQNLTIQLKTNPIYVQRLCPNRKHRKNV